MSNCIIVFERVKKVFSAYNQETCCQDFGYLIKDMLSEKCPSYFKIDENWERLKWKKISLSKTKKKFQRIEITTYCAYT